MPFLILAQMEPVLQVAVVILRVSHSRAIRCLGLVGSISVLTDQTRTQVRVRPGVQGVTGNSLSSRRGSEGRREVESE